MTMTLEQQRDVIQAAIDGKRIEMFKPTANAPMGEWVGIVPASFNFNTLDYRIAPPALRPHWPAVIHMPKMNRYIISDRLYACVEDANVAEHDTLHTGSIRLATEYPPVMLP